jgi:hypothetical protein
VPKIGLLLCSTPWIAPARAGLADANVAPKDETVPAPDGQACGGGSLEAPSATFSRQSGIAAPQKRTLGPGNAQDTRRSVGEALLCAGSATSGSTSGTPGKGEASSIQERGGEQDFHAMAGGIAEIGIEAVSHIVPAGPIFDAFREAEIGGYVAGSEQALRVGDDASEVMQSRTHAGHEHRIGRVVLAIHEDAEDASGRPEIGEIR